MRNGGWALACASEELRCDRDVVIEAVKKYGKSLCWASRELRNDREVVLAAIKNNRWALQYASDELRKDRDFVIKAAKCLSEESLYNIITDWMHQEIDA